jgi:hypothetical protein
MRIDEVTNPARDEERWSRYMQHLDRKEREFQRRRYARQKQPTSALGKLQTDPDFIAGKWKGKDFIDALKKVDAWAAQDAAKSTMK